MAGPMMIDAACLTYEGVALELEVFPRTKDDVWILGKKYNTEKGAFPFGVVEMFLSRQDKYTWRNRRYSNSGFSFAEYLHF